MSSVINTGHREMWPSSTGPAHRWQVGFLYLSYFLVVIVNLILSFVEFINPPLPPLYMNSIEFHSLVSNTEKNEHEKLSSIGKLLVGITGGLALGMTVICVPFVSPALRKICLPYVPATNNQLKNILAALKGRSGTLLDLGSGDGRIVLETAKYKFLSHGVELNRWLVYYSKFSALKNGLIGSTQFYQRDLWQYDISKYDNIVIFGVEQMMNDLEKKFLNECKANCHIIACRFPLPNWTPIKTLGQGIDKVWVYNCKKS